MNMRTHPPLATFGNEVRNRFDTVIGHGATLVVVLAVLVVMLALLLHVAVGFAPLPTQWLSALIFAGVALLLGAIPARL